MNLFVSNLSFSITEQDLMDLFTPIGEVSSLRIITDRETGRSRGFAFVEMPDDTAAQNAITNLDQTSIGGRNISVVVAKPKEDNRSGGYGGGKSYGNNSGGYSKW